MINFRPVDNPPPPERIPKVTSEYQMVLNKDPRFIAWHNFHSKILPQMVDSGEIRRVNNILIAQIRLVLGIPKEQPLPPIVWEDQDEVIKNITGLPFAIPFMTFTPEFYHAYQRYVPSSESANLEIPIEMVSLGELTTEQSVDSSIIFLLGQNAPTRVPFDERRRHEIVHGLDPMKSMREGAVINELVALSGSFATDWANNGGVSLDPIYAFNTILEHYRRLGHEQIPIERVRQDTEILLRLFDNATHQYENRRKVPNSTVACRFMNCQSLSELRETWPQIFDFTPLNQ